MDLRFVLSICGSQIILFKYMCSLLAARNWPSQVRAFVLHLQWDIRLAEFIYGPYVASSGFELATTGLCCVAGCASGPSPHVVPRAILPARRTGHCTDSPA
ncbi:hypothetical protein HAX54_052992 [Datura stramonium]|uniref:Secreted protein n=1 Tax=Datura stramonium TaxID=4076 RepID=A0ABS8SZQ8_DATST|nr:hypothetical protein [Datura stramonium]